jgi:hypothetical protein
MLTSETCDPIQNPYCQQDKDERGCRKTTRMRYDACSNWAPRRSDLPSCRVRRDLSSSNEPELIVSESISAINPSDYQINSLLVFILPSIFIICILLCFMLIIKLSSTKVRHKEKPILPLSSTKTNEETKALLGSKGPSTVRSRERMKPTIS